MAEAPNLGSDLIVRSRFEPYLQAGERILWAGRPAHLRMFGPQARRKYFSLLGRLALVVAAYGLFRAYDFSEDPDYLFRSSRPSFYLALIVIFVVLALLVTLGALLFGLMRTGSLRFASYALTDRRALAHDGGHLSGLQAENLESITRVESEMRPDGTGSISFHRKQRGWSSRLRFQEIDNVAVVLRIAQNAVRKQPPGPWA
jgi:hypothetical protein